MLKKLVILTICTQLIAVSALSNSQMALRNIQVGNLSDLPENESTEILELISRHGGTISRPESCPLESNKHLEVLGKINNIKTLFETNCLDSDQDRLKEVLEGAGKIQTELDKVNELNSSEEADNSVLGSIGPADIDVGGVKLDGKQVADILGNINQIYKERSCKGLLNNETFLEKMSDIIVDFSKIGLLVPNTDVLAVSAGGVVLSSVLLLINTLFKRRFDFEKTEDRQSFIKLNCAFYDIRRDIENSGILDVPTESHRIDQKDINRYVEIIKTRVEELNKSLKAIEKVMHQDREQFYVEKIGVLYALNIELKKSREILDREIVSNIDRLAIIEKVSQNADQIVSELEKYQDTGKSKSPFMEIIFLQEIKKFQVTANPAEVMKLVKLPLKKFKNDLVPSLKFHYDRILNLGQKSIKAHSKNWEKVAQVNGKPFKEYYKALNTEFKKKSKQLENYHSRMNNIKKRIDKVLGEKGFTSHDDGSENVVTILSDFDAVVDKIYGKYGYKFLKYTTNKSIKENKSFVKKFKKFSRLHLVSRNESGQRALGLRELSDVTELNKLYACQDAKPFRRQWRFAESLAQQGYDFVATNADLFHADIKRVFLGRSGDRKWGIHRFLSKYEKIQMHHKSSIFARKLINKEAVSSKNRSKYLKKKYLGYAMISVNNSKRYAQALQELIERYDCASVTTMK